MIHVTEQAKVELRKLLDTSVDWPGARLRLLDRGRGKLGLGIDIEGESDQVVVYEGEKVLVVEDDLASRLDCITLDVDVTEEGAELVICERT